ncbi:hemicentin-1-like isoform X2 [Acanthaster planci]|uniref:Hemicentin-1-like isoform X2 n=1 Tax=Acanthaster planci TaxID=133434 RepID=A0A8B7ZGS3_ACAPL|nr:hemicentin-1-like isoform X2 [Acanthaster planci]
MTKVPPVASSMALYDSTGTKLGPTKDVTHGIPRTYSCEVLDTRPAPTIEWYLNNTLRHTQNPDSEAADGLVNTTGTWTFASNWTNHKEVVRCLARTAESSEPYPSVMVILSVFAYPTKITLSDPSGSFPPVGGKAFLVEGWAHQFTCVVPDIDPGASFTWTIGGRHITANTNNHVTGTHGLTTSTSVATVVPTEGDHGLILQCKASNTDGHPGIATNVTLDVTVPPKVSAMSLRDSSGTILGATAEVYQGIPSIFVCQMLIRQTAVTIEWYLDDVLQRTIVQPLAAGDGFMNTSGNWSFTPNRTNEGQEVKCVARTEELREPYPSIMAVIHVKVLPTIIILSDVTGNYPITGGIAYLVVGVDREFRCMMPGIDPGASFIWMVGSQVIGPDYNTNVTDANGLFNSTSFITISATGYDHGELLKCTAWNVLNQPSISVSVLLDVKVPPKVSSMTMYDSSGARIHTITKVKRITPQTFTCEVQGTRPAATIEWFLDGESQRTASAPSGGGDGLVNTTDTWSFTLGRVNHSQQVKCVASTAESRRPFPFVAVTLDVLVPPETILLFDSTTNDTSSSGVSYVVAGVGHQFTCEVPRTNPGASFLWTLGGQEVTPDRNIHIAGEDGLTTSTSITTVTTTGSNHGDTLQCRASNEDGDPGIAVSVTLDVRVPPVASRMSLFDSAGNRLQSTVKVDEGTAQNLTCRVEGTRPAATIYWFVGDDPRGFVSSKSTAGDDLVNTSATFTFIPSRADHGQQLKCVANTSDSQQPFPSVAITLDINAPPTGLTMLDSAGSYPSSGGVAYLVEGQPHEFTCSARDIDADASFTWTLGSQGIAGTGSSAAESSSNSWSNRTSTVTVLPTESQHGWLLQCEVFSEDGPVDISTSVMLFVKVPPKVSSMILSDAAGTRLYGDVELDEGTPTMFWCDVQGTRPAPVIEWFLNDVLQSTKSPSSGGGNRLVNTTDSWTLTPSRFNHRQELKCLASTADSNQPLPFVTVTLIVNGPPDSPIIIGSPSMTENISTLLECQASMGFPSDWSLHWYSGDEPLPSNQTASAPQDNRFMFTSFLRFTPTRDNNGDTIRCVARKESWTDPPETSLGPLDVQFCTQMIHITGCPRRVMSGRSVSLSCAAETANPSTNLTWLRDNVQHTSHAQPVLTDGDYGGQVTTLDFITGVLTKRDSGALFKCCATSSICSKLCGYCSLNVQYRPYFSEPIATPLRPVDEGDDVILSCSAEANPMPPGFITWEKVGFPDSLSSVYAHGTSILTLRNISRDQAGPYRCRGNNGVPPVVYSSQINVAVHYEVSFVNKKPDNFVEANVGEDALLVCVVKGNPLPIVIWSSPLGALITNQTEPGRLFQVDSLVGGDYACGYTVKSILHFSRVTGEGDYGYYSCSSGSGIGMVGTLRIQLKRKVQETTTFPSDHFSEMGLTTTTQGGIQVTTFTTRGHPTSTLTLIAGPTTVVPAVDGSTSASPFEVSSTTTAPVKPLPPQHVTIDGRSHDSITITWIPGNDERSAQWFYVNYREVLTTTDFNPSTRSKRLGHDVTEYTLVDLRAYTVYEIEVNAENDVGSSEAAKLIVATLRKPTDHPQYESIGEKPTKTPAKPALPYKADGVQSKDNLGLVAAVVVLVVFLLIVSMVLAVVVYRKYRTANTDLSVRKPMLKKYKPNKGKSDETSVTAVELNDLDPEEVVTGTSFA